jgi:hypothetical protein
MVAPDLGWAPGATGFDIDATAGVARPRLEYEHFPDSLVFFDDGHLVASRNLAFNEFPDCNSAPYAFRNRNTLTIG